MPKHKPVRDKKYLEYIRNQPCLCCGHIPSEAHHESLDGGTMGGKTNDKSCIPLCYYHHHHRHNMGRDTFYNFHDIDYRKEIENLQKRYEDT